jgi:hypothetical protein
MRALRFLLHLVCFAAALVAGCLGIGVCLPLEDLPDVAQKLRFFAAHKDEFDTLFVGSSRVLEHLDPHLFDREMAARGRPTRSFNFGLQGMLPPEDSYVLEHILATRPARLRTVFLEVSMFRAKFEAQEPEALRTAYWHDWTRTELVRRALFDGYRFNRKKWRSSIEKLRERGGFYAMHLRLWARKVVNLGRGAELMPWRRPAPQTGALGPRLDGFPEDKGSPMPPERRAQYERELPPLLETPVPRKPLVPAAQENLERMIARIRAAGAEPVLLIAPMVSPLIFVPRREVAPLLDFSDPRHWPELFQIEHRRDTGHLNRAGSQVYTRLVVQEFVAMK